MSRDNIVNKSVGRQITSFEDLAEATKEFHNQLNKQEDNTMNRRTVTIELIDQDKGLPVENSLVARYENVMTEDDDETTIRELLMSRGVGEDLEMHNKIRGKTINVDALQRLGREIYLQPVKLKQLQWVIKN